MIEQLHRAKGCMADVDDAWGWGNERASMAVCAVSMGPDQSCVAAGRRLALPMLGAGLPEPLTQLMS